MHTLIAVGTSVVLGLVTIRPGDYRYWHYWAGGTFALASLGLLVTYGVAGLVGFVVLHAVEPSGASAGAAAVEGLAGHAVFRAKVEFGGVSDEPSGTSLVGLVRRWLLDLLNGSTRSNIRTRLSKLSDDQLKELTLGIFWENNYDGDQKLDAAVVEQYDRLTAATELLVGATAIDPRARLRGYCLAEIQRHRLVLETD